MTPVNVNTFLTVMLICASAVWSQNDYTITIGEQVWMARNLDVSLFRNGDSIPEAKTNAEWEICAGQRKPAWCYYGMDSTNHKQFGKLYNWFAVNDPRGLAPQGWHVPSDSEWQKLIDFLAGDSIAGGAMKDTNNWESPNTAATNKSGFSAIPGGYRYHDGFYYKGYTAFFFSSTENATTTAWTRLLNHDNSQVYRYFGNKWDGYSVRCLKD